MILGDQDGTRFVSIIKWIMADGTFIFKYTQIQGDDMKPEFCTELITKELLGSKYAELMHDFVFTSAVLKRTIRVPKGFICDYESVPVFKATSKRAGVIHDYLCRIDSAPVVSKQIAAAVYAEAQQLRDHLVCKSKFKLCWRAILCWSKTSVVRVWPGYYHKFKVLDDPR